MTLDPDSIPQRRIQAAPLGGQACIGTSGWSYREWQTSFYGNTPQREWLRFCGGRFTAVEVNATFYRLQHRSTFQRWRDETPPGFRFAIKGNRELTHRRKLVDPLATIELDHHAASGLGNRLAVVLWQLPYSLRRDLPRLEALAAALQTWPEARHAIEFRHPSWFNGDVAALLRRYALAACLSDAADWPMWDTVTTNLVYVRLHGHTETYVSEYSEAELHRWSQRVQEWLAEGRDVHVYFDNTAAGHAPANVLRMMELLGLKSFDPVPRAAGHPRQLSSAFPLAGGQ